MAATMSWTLSILVIMANPCEGKNHYSDDTIAFSAIKTKHQNSRNSRTVNFDSCHVNVGGGFNVSRGVFIAPVSGLYVFNYQALTGDDSRRFIVGLYQNGEVIVSAYARETRWWAMGGNGVILDLVRGDVVGLKFMYGENDLWGSLNERYATFNGYLIAPKVY